jgi:hypothetical protein
MENFQTNVSIDLTKFDIEQIFNDLLEYWDSHSKEHDYYDDGFYSLRIDDEMSMIVRWLPFVGIGEVTSAGIWNGSDEAVFYISRMPIPADGFVSQGRNGWYYKSKYQNQHDDDGKVAKWMEQFSDVPLAA